MMKEKNSDIMIIVNKEFITMTKSKQMNDDKQILSQSYRQKILIISYTNQT